MRPVLTVGAIRFGQAFGPVEESWPEKNIEIGADIIRLSWKEWQHELRANDPHEAESIDGDWRMPATRPSLASLHANPLHSAERRVRCFAGARKWS